MRAVWITWERHRRTREIARALQVPLVEITSERGSPWKYGPLTRRTTTRLLALRPGHLIVQCPSVVLASLCVALRPLFRYALILDLHNEAVVPFANRSRGYARLIRRLHRSADLCLVTNEALVPIVEGHGGRACVLPDRIPGIRPVQYGSKEERRGRVVFVCSFAADEPVGEVVAAAGLLADVALIHVTGRVPVQLTRAGLPANLKFTGYLADEDYEQLLREADVVVDLTAKEDCLVCGGYEAVALAKPLVTSDTLALRTYFRRGTVFTRHDPASIADAIRTALDRRSALTDEMRALRPELERDWESRRAHLVHCLQGAS